MQHLLLALAFLWSNAALAADVCRDAAGKFTACPETLIEPEVVPPDAPGPKDCTVTGCPTHGQVCTEVARGNWQCLPLPAAKAEAPQRLRFRMMGGALTSIATDTEASLEPLASLGIEAPLSTSERGPSLEVQADLTALPGEALNLSDPLTFNALEMHVGISQPLPLPLLFSVYAEGGFASRLATSSEPVTRLPGWASFGFLFRTADRDHSLRVGIGPDERLSGEWAAAVHISGQAKIGERAGVSLYLVGSLVRALDLSAYGYTAPARDALRLGIAVGM